MHKLLVLYPEPTDRAAFQEYYESIHLPLVAKMPGILAWRYSFSLERIAGGSSYFALFEADFADADAMGAAMASPEGKAVQADVPNYATGGAEIFHYSLA